MPNDSSDTAGIQRALAAIESPGYFDDTYAASYHQVVEAILLEKPELQLLRAHCAQACPMVLARMKSDGDAERPAMIAYALIMRESREIDAIPILVERIRMFDADDTSTDALLSPWHPFIYCMKTLEALTGGAVAVGSIDDAVRERARIIDAALGWYDLHKKSPR